MTSSSTIMSVRGVALALCCLAFVGDAFAADAKKSDETNASTAAPNSDRPEKSPNTGGDSPLVLETFEVMSSKLLNMDLRRTRDDAQPYVVFERERIEQSGASDISEFLKRRLTMNTGAVGNSQNSGNFVGPSSAGELNLRGLGAAQTLLLVDGHRISDLNLGSVAYPPDLNGIPVAAIERIEVLPTTAGGIYGGSATGGVINVILRRDFTGSEVRLTYENTFHTDSSRRRLDFSTGFLLEGGKTNVLLSGSYSNSNALWSQDRPFYLQGINAVLRNNPPAVLNLASPPIGATPNLRATDGTALVLKTGVALNSPITFVPYGYTGTAADKGAALVANAGRFNLDLAPSAQYPQGGRQSLLNNPERESVSLTVRRQMSSRLQLFFEANASNNRGRSDVSYFYSTYSSFALAATAPNNPFTKAITVTVPSAVADSNLSTTLRNRRLVGGLIAKLPEGWTAELDYTWQRNVLSYFQPPAPLAAGRTALANGTIDVLRDTIRYPITDLVPYLASVEQQPGAISSLADVSVRIGGDLLRLPAGSLRLNGLLEHRAMDQEKAYVNDPASNFVQYFPGRQQQVESGYVELAAPVVTEGMRVPGLAALDLQLAFRRDRYQTKVSGAVTALALGTPRPGDTPVRNQVSASSPTAAVRYTPLHGLALRASYGEGFFAPGADSLLPSPNGSATLIDPRRGGASYFVSGATFGGNPNLRPERSRSVSAGLVLAPARLAGLRLSVDYTRIRKRDNIGTLTPQQIVDNEALLPGRVTRGANLPTDPAGWAGPITTYNATALNISALEVEAYDGQLDYTRGTADGGKWDTFVAATWETHYRTQLLSTAPVVENAGNGRSSPLKFKAAAGVNWTRGPWRLGWSTNHFNSYLVANPVSSTAATLFLSQGARRVASQTYHDVFLSYRFSSSPAARHLSRWMGGTEVRLSVKNVFDVLPPFDASSSTGFYYSPFGDPSGALYQLSVKRSF